MASLGACPGFYSISLATCVSGSTPFPAHIHPTPPHLHPLSISPGTQVCLELSGPLLQAIGALTLKPCGGVAPGNLWG